MNKTMLSTLIGTVLLAGGALAQASAPGAAAPNTSHHERMMTGMQHMDDRARTEMMQACHRMMDQPQR